MKKVVMTEMEVIELMREKGFILAVDFTKIEHLGVYKQRKINCVLYSGSPRVIPKVYCELILTEQQILNIINHFVDKGKGTLWVCDDSEFFSPNRTRYFSVCEPQRPFWSNC